MLLLGAGLVGLGLSAWLYRRAPAGVSPGSGPPRPNFLIIDIDTLSADRVGAMNAGRPVTPTLDALAARGVRFNHAISQSGWTMPALVSHLTGVLPVTVSAEDGEVAWRPAGTRDLAEILAIYGYETAAFWGATLPGKVTTVLSSAFAENIFDHDRGEPPTDALIAWLQRPRDQPFFAYVHDIDLQFPDTYLGVDRKLAFDEHPLPENATSFAHILLQISQSSTPEAGQKAVRDRYDGVIHAYDAALSRVLAALESSGQADNTVVIVTSDHGQDLFEHANIEHGLLYDTILRVPLIVVDPLGDRGKTVDTMVQSIDLAPSVLARAGVPRDEQMDGQSWTSLIGLEGIGLEGIGLDSPVYEERAVFSLTEPCHVSLRTRTHKLILRDIRPRRDRGWPPVWRPNQVPMTLSRFVAANPLPDVPLADCSTMSLPTPSGAPKVAGAGPNTLGLELYDLVADPGERNNRVEDTPEVARALLEPLLHTLADRRKALATRATMSAAQVQAMKDQGYWGLVQPGAEGTPGTVAPAPPTPPAPPAGAPAPAPPPPHPG